jgi:hypothetical protein
MNASAPIFVPPSSPPSIGKPPQTQQEQAAEAVTGRVGRGQRSKQKHQQANHLAAFHSGNSRQKNHGSGQDRGRLQQHKPHRKHTPTSAYRPKEHFLATNYRYVVSSYANFIQTGFFDPDEMVAWEDIQLVIATLDRDSAAESCAICLEESIILPQLTKCGHIFCLTCLLRYLESEYSKKCPVCSRCQVCRADLRDVMFVATPPPLLKSSATFSLLSKDKTSLFPVCHDDASESLLSCPDLQSLLVSKKGEKAIFDDDFSSEAAAVGIPEIDTRNSQYSRICYASPQKLIRFVNQSLKTLDNFRKLCLAAGSTEFPTESRGDVEYLVFLPEASALLTARKEVIKSQQEKVSSSRAVSSASSARPSTAAAAAAAGMSESSPVWLYQQQAGHLSFLHPLCMRALLHQQAQAKTQLETSLSTTTATALDQSDPMKEDPPLSVENIQLTAEPAQSSPPGMIADTSQMSNSLPCRVSGTVLEIDTCTVTPEQRKRYPFIRHLPLDCVFSLVEIDMRSILDPATYALFKGPFRQREADRKARRNKQLRDDKKDKQRLTSQQEQIIAGRKELHQHREAEKQNAIQSLLSSPLVGSLETPPLHPLEDFTAEGLESGAEGQEGLVTGASQSEKSNNSFANITQMGVSNDEAFPTLGGGGGGGGGGWRGGGACGGAVGSTAPSSAWGAQRGGDEAAGSTVMNDQANNNNKTASTHSKKKKGKKFVASSAFFATSGARSYR